MGKTVAGPHKKKKKKKKKKHHNKQRQNAMMISFFASLGQFTEMQLISTKLMRSRGFFLSRGTLGNFLWKLRGFLRHLPKRST